MIDYRRTYVATNAQDVTTVADSSAYRGVGRRYATVGANLVKAGVKGL